MTLSISSGWVSPAVGLEGTITSHHADIEGRTYCSQPTGLMWRGRRRASRSPGGGSAPLHTRPCSGVVRHPDCTVGATYGTAIWRIQRADTICNAPNAIAYHAPA